MPVEINTVFIEPESKASNAPFCEVCRIYYRWSETKWFCSGCGTIRHDEPLDEKLPSLKPEPLIVSKQKKKEEVRWQDFPRGVQIIKDELVN